MVLLVQDKIDGFFRLARCRYDEAFVAFQHLQPILDVGGIVAEAAGGFKPDVIDQRCRPDFCHQFFLAVIRCAEEGGVVQAVQPLFVPGGMGDFVEGCAVVFSGYS